jgi:non-ribosomal peptide synthetase component F
VPRNPSSYAPLQNQILPQLFEQQAARTPHATAVVFGTQKLQYKELNYRANQVARYLGGRGTGPGSLVGVGVERSLEMIVAILGILKTGAAYVPLDPSYPKDRLAWMLSDCGAPILLTVSSGTDRFSGYGGLVLCLDREWPAIRREETANLSCRAQCGDRAYVMYTSGSAGWPKGAEIAHRSVVNAAHAMRAKIGMDASDVLVSVSSLSSTFTCWMFGCRWRVAHAW